MLNRVSPARSTGDDGGAIDWVARAREVAPVVAAAAHRIEDNREIPDDVVSALHGAQMFRLLLPRSCDGGELQPAEYVQVIEEIAKADASTAWCMGQGNGGAIAAAYLDRRIAREIFGDARAVVASGPSFGTAVAVDGGYRVSGAWAFASGCKHATWLAAHCLVQEGDGSQRLDPDGQPFERTMFFPKSKATFTDIWHVVGLKGTGSDKYAVEDLFVPADYSYTREWRPERRETGTLYRFSNYHMFGVAFAGVALGIARATLDAFIALAREKVPRYATQVLRDSLRIQYETGLAETRLQAAHAFLLTTLRELWEVAERSDIIPLEERARLRMAIINSSYTARKVVDAAYYAAGATSVFESNPFERRFRDMHTVSQQVQAHASNFELLGQHLLGLNPKSKYL